MPIHFNFSYKNYPFSPKATNKSRQLGVVTCTTVYITLGFFWLLLVTGLFSVIGLGDVAIILGFISLIGYVFLMRYVKKTVSQKVDAIALADLLALKQTDPDKFLQYLDYLPILYQSQQTAQQQAAPKAPPVQEPVAETPPEQPKPQPQQAAPVQKVFCGQCGAKLKSGALFCHNCGSKL